MLLLLPSSLTCGPAWAQSGTSWGSTPRQSFERPALKNLNLGFSAELKNQTESPTGQKPPQFRLFKNPDKLIKKESLETQKNGGGEWGSSGGGSGVACFKSTSLAQEAKSYVAQNRTLPIEIIEQIDTVETLDFWEAKDILAGRLKHFSKKKPEVILDEVYWNFSHLFPLFVFRLEQASQLIHFSDWEPTATLPKISDIRIRKELPAHCILVQLAVRWTKEKDFSTNKPFQSLPRVKVEFNPFLYDKLDNINKAVLKLHEQLYLLSQLNGETTSDTIRHLSVLFLTEDFKGKSISGKFQRSARAHLVNIFGDYVFYFGDGMIFSAKNFSQESRYNSLYKYINTISSQVEECEKGLWSQDRKIPWRSDRKEHSCLDFANHPVSLSSWMTPEMAFLYISFSLIDVSLGEMNSEYLVTPFSSPSLIAVSESNLKFACRKILELHLQDPLYDKLLHKAQNYCQNIMSLPTPMEINQN